MTDSTILFADIAGSTSLYENLGDDEANLVVNSSLEALSLIVKNNNGKVIKTIGDEIMCQFGSVESAIAASGAMHVCTQNNRFGNQLTQIAIRIGAHTGPVIEVENDINGDTVNVAARVAALTQSGKTMISESSYQALPAYLKSLCRFMLETQLKGKEELVSIYNVIWENNDQLTLVAQIPRVKSTQKTLSLTYGEHETTLSQGVLTIGRAQTCDVVIHSTEASRLHCEIQMNGNKFLLKDNSTNGCYVNQNNVEMFFHSESVPLHQSGIISVGQSSKNVAESELIYFNIS